MTPEQKIISEIKQLLELISVEYSALKDNLPENDIRPGFYGLPGNVLHSFYLQMNSFDSTICEKSWWLIKFNKTEPTTNDIKALNSLEKFSKHAFLVFYFSRIETNIKKIINFISPGFDPKNNEKFKFVYDKFFNKLDLVKFIPLFDVVRHIRNTLHSNGIYISNSATDSVISWKEKKYTFKHLQQIDFLTNEELLFIFHELFYCLKEIMNTPNIKSPTLIEDKFY